MLQTSGPQLSVTNSNILIKFTQSDYMLITQPSLPTVPQFIQYMYFFFISNRSQMK